MSNSEAQLASFVSMRSQDTPEVLLAIAVRDAVKRLRDNNWLGGKPVIDNDDTTVVVWTPDETPVQMSFAFDADMHLYWWASRAGHDRAGRWCRSPWGQYRPDQDRVLGWTDWVNAIAR